MMSEDRDRVCLVFSENADVQTRVLPCTSVHYCAANSFRLPKPTPQVEARPAYEQ